MKPNTSITFFKHLVTIPVLLLFSCITHNDRLSSTDDYLYQQDYKAAYHELIDQKEHIYRKDKDAILYQLDSGMLALHARAISNSLEHLSKADFQMEDLRKKNIGEQIGASIINDSLITYNGYNYEFVFTSMMMSLGYLQQNKFDSGFVEIRRTQDKLQKIQVDNDVLLSEFNQNKNAYVDLDTIKTPFVDSAFARLLSFWLYRADRDFTNMEVAERKYNEAIVSQPEIYTFAPPTIEEEQYSTEHSRIQVVALTDRNPILYAKTFSLNAVENGVIISSYNEFDSLPGNLTTVGDNNFMSNLGLIPIPGLPSSGLSIVFSIPAMAKYDKQITGVEVWIEGQKIGNLSLTESLENIAVKTFQEESKFIYGRQISRVIIKALSGAAANQVDPLLGLVSQIINNVSEKADLRIGRYFPANIWTGDFVMLEKGEYEVTLKYHDSEVILRQKTIPISITQDNDVFNLIVDSYL